MDLLVHLVKKNELDICDIPIALITEQYLEYIEWMKAMNMDLAGEFLVMAATLTQIKSRMLLPVQVDEEAEEAFLQEVTRPLQEYLQMKSVAEQLSLRPLLGEDTFTRHPDSEVFLEDAQTQFIKVGLFELIDALSHPGDGRSSEFGWHGVMLPAAHDSVTESTPDDRLRSPVAGTAGRPLQQAPQRPRPAAPASASRRANRSA